MKLFVFILSAALAAAVAEEKCLNPGIFASSDPHKFRVCAENDGVLSTTELECSEGLVFDFSRKRCSVPSITALLRIGGSGWDSAMNATTPGYADENSTIPSGRAVESVKPLPCKNPGAMCDTCNTLSFCVSTSANTVRKILTLQCESGSVCVTKQGCVRTASGGLCRQGKFRCGDVGTYPDLYDCTKYHSCNIDSSGELVGEERQCTGGPNGNRWSPENSQCGWPENVAACRGYPIPTCDKELQMGSIGGQIYFICIVDRTSHTLSPTLFRCPGNSKFDPAVFGCTMNSTAMV